MIKKKKKREKETNGIVRRIGRRRLEMKTIYEIERKT